MNLDLWSLARRGEKLLPVFDYVKWRIFLYLVDMRTCECPTKALVKCFIGSIGEILFSKQGGAGSRWRGRGTIGEMLFSKQ